MKNFGQKKSCRCLQKFWFCSHFLQTEVRGKFHSLWVKICWSWNSNNRNIVTGQAEFIAGDWITWWRFKFRLYAKKILSNFIFKSFENFQKIFSFSKIEKSEKFRFCLLKYFPFSENISQISIFQISISQISKRQNRKFSDFSIFENENIFWNFSKLLNIKFDNIFFAYSRNLKLHHVSQSPTTNSAWPVTIFRLFEFHFSEYLKIFWQSRQLGSSPTGVSRRSRIEDIEIPKIFSENIL